MDQEVPAALMVQRHDTGPPGGHRDQERRQRGFARPGGAGDQRVADIADLPVEAIGGAGQGAEDRNRRPRPVPALLARRPVVERREGNEVRRLDEPRPRPPEPACGQHRQVGRLQRVRHPGRDQPARREVAPGRIADLGDRAGAVGKGDQHQAMVAQTHLRDISSSAASVSASDWLSALSPAASILCCLRPTAPIPAALDRKR